MLVQTSTHLVAVGQDCQELWKTPAPEQPLSGGPVDIEGTWVLASRDGRLWKIDPDSGRVLATYDAMQGVAAPPTSRGSDLLLGSDEGAVLTVPLSDFEEQ
ncbi:MAG: hypothetical protein D6753_10865 [Planctomycetota bacterium]|nr:MAG: hypothetical protein D6753_10865 [Planctomycetota bacterium]